MYLNGDAEHAGAAGQQCWDSTSASSVLLLAGPVGSAQSVSRGSAQIVSAGTQRLCHAQQ